MSNKEVFIGLVRENIKRDGVEDLLNLIEKTDFFIAPASTKYHNSYAGGLVDHSLNVLTALVKFAPKEIPYESLVLVALFHDICKLGYYVIDYKNQKVYKKNGTKSDEKGRFDWETIAYYTVDDKLPLGHGEKSVFMILDKMKLTVEETMAIRWHMGGYESKENYQSISKAYEEYPLALYLHLADMEATYVLDKRGA